MKNLSQIIFLTILSTSVYSFSELGIYTPKKSEYLEGIASQKSLNGKYFNCGANKSLNMQNFNYYDKHTGFSSKENGDNGIALIGKNDQVVFVNTDKLDREGNTSRMRYFELDGVKYGLYKAGNGNWMLGPDSNGGEVNYIPSTTNASLHYNTYTKKVSVAWDKYLDRLKKNERLASDIKPRFSTLSACRSLGNNDLKYSVMEVSKISRKNVKRDIASLKDEAEATQLRGGEGGTTGGAGSGLSR